MIVRVIWSDGKEREVEVQTLAELDRFVGWHNQEARDVDLQVDDDGFRLLVNR